MGIPDGCRGCRWYRTGTCELVSAWYREYDPQGMYECAEERTRELGEELDELEKRGKRTVAKRYDLG